MKTSSFIRRCGARRFVPAVVLAACVVSGGVVTRSLGQESITPIAPAAAPMDAKTIAAIRDEGMNRSHVMETMDYLCNVIGPRLTGSPNLKRANEWTKDQMQSWGMVNGHLEAWGPFGRGWTLKRFSLEVFEPQVIPLRGFAKAWSPGLEGPVETGVVFIDAQTEADLAKYEGKLKGQVVLIGAPRTLTPAYQPLAKRFGEEELAKAETYPAGTALQVTDVVPARGGGGGGGAGRGRGGRGAATATAPATQAGGAAGGPIPVRPGALASPGIAQRALAMATSEGAALVLDSSSQGDGGVIFVASATVPAPAGGAGFGGGGSAYSVNAPKMPPQATLAIEDYDRLVRMIRQGQQLKMAVNFKTEFTTDDTMAYNTIAEIPGTDPVLKDQIVMIGAHMDSWHSGTGATDNGAGCGAVLEAVRILTALHLQPRRTIRVGLWSGEEQGLLGSAAYVRAHFGGPAGRGGGRGGRGADAAATQVGPGGDPIAASAPAVTRGPEFEKLSVYFNLDNGTGKIRGIYAQGNEAGAAYFKEWFGPFADLGAKTVTLGTNGQTDHISFDNAGLPGFQFIQDSIDYFAKTHHSNADVYERLQPEDMKVNATIMAAFLWDAANMDERFPRKAAAPAGARGGRGGE